MVFEIGYDRLVLENPLKAVHHSINISVERNYHGYWTATFNTPLSWYRIERPTAVAAYAASKAHIDSLLDDDSYLLGLHINLEASPFSAAAGLGL